ncbi:MAG: hydrogenase expression/formation protein HypE [Spirochaetales bacterium]|nr:hydrogenase expression/formation protein HypE [Spirochaetales bacterium]
MKDKKTIRLEHGSGGVLTRQLIEEIIYPYLKNDSYSELDDASLFPSPAAPGEKLAFTTDSYVVDPPIFRGGNIGKLAVFGTANDLAVSGAEPLYMSLGVILEQGFSIDDFESIIKTLAQSAREANVKVITGDTKVVPAGKGGGVFLNTAGIGRQVFPHSLGGSRVQIGDKVILSNHIGAHGVAILSQREGLELGTTIQSDCAFLYPLCRELYSLGLDLRFLRDATRGGIAAVLNEVVEKRDFAIEIDEEAIPVLEDVKSTIELLGLNLYEIANEGAFIAIMAADKAEEAVVRLKKHPSGSGSMAAIIGKVTQNHCSRVVVNTAIGGQRLLDFPRGLLLPRIC